MNGSGTGGVGFLDGLLVSFEAVGQLFLIALVGFAAVRRGYLTKEGINSITRMMIDIIIPCALVFSLTRGFQSSQLDQYYPVILLSTLWMAISVIGLLLLFRAWPGGTPSADRAAAAMGAFHNNIYIPLPIALAILPPQHHSAATVMISLGLLAASPLQWSLGLWLVAGERSAPDWKSSLRTAFNIPTLAIVASVGLVWLYPPLQDAALRTPDSNMLLRMILSAMEFLGRAMGPLATLVLGAMIAECRLGKSLTLRILTPVLLTRFLLVPGIVFLLLRSGAVPMTGEAELVAFMLMVAAAAPPSVNLALAARRFHGEWEVVSALGLVTNLLALIALPLWISVGLSFGVQVAGR